MDRHLALHCFCRVVETGGFAAAARDLGHSPSMVSKTIQDLKAWTGSRLLARTTRRMQLTEAGERFYAYCRRVLDDTESTLGAIRAVQGELSGRLVLAVPVSLTLSFLKGLLHAFQAAHPGIELELRLSDRQVDLVRDGVDVALRGQAQLEDSSLIAVPLMKMQRAVAAAPDYWPPRQTRASIGIGLAQLPVLPPWQRRVALGVPRPRGTALGGSARQSARRQQPDADRRDAARHWRRARAARDDARPPRAGLPPWPGVPRGRA